ncbi:MAG: hypothetical protein JNK48_11820 [Bryobacterales bacterium]|nr:hypothetical protein [Bryobacterales bacterium]
MEGELAPVFFEELQESGWKSRIVAASAQSSEPPPAKVQKVYRVLAEG